MDLKKAVNFLFLSLFILSCNNKKSNKSDSISSKETDFQYIITKTKSVTLPLKTKKYIECINFDGTYYELDSTCKTLNNETLKYINNTFSRRENISDFYLAKEKKYFSSFHYKFNKDIYVVGFLVEFWLEDRKGVSLQINTFDSFGKQIDYLIVLCRYTNEGIFYKMDFSILDKFKQIKIINVIETNGTTGSKPNLIKKESIYVISDKGFFKEKKNK